MKLDIPIFDELTLSIADEPDGHMLYPTAHLQKGLAMVYRGQDLAEEAVGFGLPVFKRGLQTIFPGKVELDLQRRGLSSQVTAIYTMNLVEKIARPGSSSVKSGFIYTAKNYLAAFIRHFPPIRVPLTAISSGLRRVFGWETTYEAAGFSAKVKLVYTFDRPGASFLVEATTDSHSLDGLSDMIIMNEQGAHYFDQYNDASGACLSGKEIGCWDEVGAAYASFASSIQRVAFTLSQVAGARLFRGRELIGSRLAWAGFGVSFPLTSRVYNYTVRLEKLP